MVDNNDEKTSVINLFDRQIPLAERSFSLRAFNAYETEINEHYWSFQAISNYARYIATNEKRKDPLKSTASVFRATGPDAGRIPPTVSDWLVAREQLENWLRLSALVSASSYLEIFLRQITRSALLSDPLCRFGASKCLDGVALLKKGEELQYDDEVERVTRGDWNSRLSAFEKIFGSRPTQIGGYISSLEKIRKIRNEFAHGFGRNLSVPLPYIEDVRSATKLKSTVFVQYLGILSRVAATFDAYLLNNHIGSYEIIHFYHDWKTKPVNEQDAKYEHAARFRRTLNRDLSCPANTKYCEDLIEFYNSVN